ncbi:50S ribosomal protein L37ae [Candidatus Pacearchaeota archaeon]|nr:50S ribosomal protein L37ae [Candidatus Pacearchaeota archaeon]|tara:strand:- start:403 stop:630 length:228 start_codon:yes stop_codon:yes gene_type:complete
MARTKKVKASGKHKVGYGTNVRKKLVAIESKQRVAQKSPFHPKGKAKRLSPGIWKCTKTGKVFAGQAFYLEEEKQ